MNDIVITFDVDWAPDFMVRKVANILIEKEIKATWFITHDSPAIRELFEYPNLFEIGVHPNFMPGSTQGNNYRAVMSYVMNIAPNAKTVRTHGMFYSAVISKMFAVDFGLEVDNSIFLGEMPHIIPFEVFYGDRVLLRIPYFWSDDGEMSIKPSPSFSLCDKKFNVPGLKILCFHPIHIFLNSSNINNYNNLKRRCDIIRHCTEDEAEPFVNGGSGTSSLLSEIIESNPNLGGFKTVSEIAKEWKSKNTDKWHLPVDKSIKKIKLGVNLYDF
jgi:hypothetical protein